MDARSQLGRWARHAGCLAHAVRAEGAGALEANVDDTKAPGPVGGRSVARCGSPPCWKRRSGCS